jgi:RimJ/RimL family protein N-acetyltransferase
LPRAPSSGAWRRAQRARDGLQLRMQLPTLETARLRIVPLSLEDAPFIVELVNDPAWIRFIGDKNVHSTADAEAYLRNGPLAMYARYGVGLFKVVRLGDGGAIGMCGLIRRDGLDDVDIGFAFLPAARGHGYAAEAAAVVLEHGFSALGLKRIVAITDVVNHASARVLEKIGMSYVQTMRLPNDSTDLKLYEARRA